MNCAVCYETSTEVMTCLCGVVCCVECMKKWVVEDTRRDIKCVGCTRIFHQDEIMRHMDQEFIRGEYADWRGRFIFEKEMVFMAEDMVDAARENRRRYLMTAIRSLMVKKRALIRHKLPGITSIRQQLSDYRKEAASYRKNTDKKPIVLSLILPCPSEQCRGFITTAYNCTLCATMICNRCLQVHDGSDGCMQEHIDSATAIMKDTKPCPRCAVRIHKISGCDQMWCVSCHCAFLWSTGQPVINSTTLHNPHYFEWLFNGGAAGGAAGGGGFNELIYHHLRILSNVEYEVKRAIYELIRLTIHVEEVVMHRYLVNTLKTNKDIRVRYLVGDMTRDEVEKLMYKREKRNLKKDAIFHILSVCIDAWKQSVYHFVMEDQYILKLRKEITATGNYGIESISNILDNYGGGFPEMQVLENVLMTAERWTV